MPSQGVGAVELWLPTRGEEAGNGTNIEYLGMSLGHSNTPELNKEMPNMFDQRESREWLPVTQVTKL